MNQKKKYHTYIIILFFLLIFLILLTTAILVLRITDFAPLDTNTVFLVEKNAEFSVDDKDQIWDTKSEINIFSSSFSNKDDKVVIKSDNENNVLAPGSYNSYTFNLKNTGNMALDYNVSMKAVLKKDDKEINLNELPLLIRIKNYNEEYFIGSKEIWEPIEKINDFLESGTLGINNYAYYTFEWKWPFDENNEIDTTLGIIANNEDIDLTIDILTNAKLSDNADAKGGIALDIPVFGETIEVGGTIKKGPFVTIIILIIITILLLVYFHKKINKLKKRGGNFENH